MNEQPRAGMSIDPEMLAAYIDKRLTPEQRAQVEAQLAADPKSYELLVESMKALEALEDENKGARAIPFVPKRTGIRPNWMIAAAALSAAASALIVLRLMNPADRDSLARLAATVDDHRVVEAPLSGGFTYRPFAPQVRGPASAVPAADWDLLAVVTEAEENAKAGQPDHHLLGVGYLLLARNDDAVRELKQAAEASPTRADILTDYAAALLERGRVNKSAADLRDARTAVERALTQQRDRLETLFTRALILEATHDPEAAAAWKEYLAADSTSPWAAEASEHLGRVR